MTRKVLLCLLTILVSSVSVYPQQASLTLDHVDGIVNPGANGPIGDSVIVDTRLKFWFRMTNNSGANMPYVLNAFRVYSPDGAVWEPISFIPYLCATCFDYIVLWNGDANWPDWHLIFNDNIFVHSYSIDGLGADTIGWGGQSKFPSLGLPDGFDTIVYVIETTIDASQEGLTICLDSSWAPPWIEWAWTSDTGEQFSVIPEWNGPFCWTIVNCCDGIRGNVDNDPDDKINMGDVVYLVSYFFDNPSFKPPPPCATETDVNGNGELTVSDLTYLINYLFGIPGGPLPPSCP